MEHKDHLAACTSEGVSGADVPARATLPPEEHRDPDTGRTAMKMAPCSADEARARLSLATGAASTAGAKFEAHTFDFGRVRDPGTDFWSIADGLHMTQAGADALATQVATVLSAAEFSRLQAVVARAYDIWNKAHFGDEDWVLNVTRFHDLLGGEYGAESWPDDAFLSPAPSLDDGMNEWQPISTAPKETL